MVPAGQNSGVPTGLVLWCPPGRTAMCLRSSLVVPAGQNNGGSWSCLVLPAGQNSDVPAGMIPRYRPSELTAPTAASSALRQPNQPCDKAAASWCMDTLGIEPRASRMLSGCDTTTPRALCGSEIQLSVCAQKHSAQRSSALLAEWHVGAADAAGSLSRVDHPAQLKCRQPRNAAVAQGEPAAPHGAIHI